MLMIMSPGLSISFWNCGIGMLSDVLTDAQVYSAEHAGKSTIDSDDVKLAIQSKVNFSFSQPPPRQMLLELARSRNKIPLPKSITQYGIPLPSEQDTLISPNYQPDIPKMHGGWPTGPLKKQKTMKKVRILIPKERPKEYRFLLELNIQDNFFVSATALRSKQESCYMNQIS